VIVLCVVWIALKRTVDLPESEIVGSPVDVNGG
jgi:hypothetical protein